MAAFAGGGCASLAPDYSLESYKSATSLKAEVQALATESSEDFSGHATEVQALSIKLQSAYEFSAGLPNNAVVTDEWSRLLSPDKPLYGDFIQKWRTRGRFSPVEADEKRRLLGRAFDQIICAEASKQGSTTCRAAASASQP